MPAILKSFFTKKRETEKEMRLAIFGLPYSGKTTVFNCITGKAGDEGSKDNEVASAGAKGKPSLGVVKVPDERVDELSRVYKPKKTTYAEIVFEDIPSPQDYLATGILDTQAAAKLRNSDVLVIVVRGFVSPLLEEQVDSLRDLSALDDELILADLGVVEKRVQRLLKTNSITHETKALQKCLQHMESGLPLRTLDLSPVELEAIKGFALLSLKKLLVLLNTPEDSPEEIPLQLVESASSRGASIMGVCGSLEAEIATLPPEEQRDFLADLGVESSGRDRFIKHAFESLDLISFLTSGEDECRAWPITRGTSARAAAATIHSDIERGFIRAEVLSFDDFTRCGCSEKKAKAAGLYRLEGKDYEVQDGDIISYRFNV